MSRSGYSDYGDDDYSSWDAIRWRGMVTSAMRGKRGQQLLRDLQAALEAMPVKRLVKGALQTADGEVCSLGAVAAFRGVQTGIKPNMDEYDWDESTWNKVAKSLNIAEVLAREIMYYNDDWFENCAPEVRWVKMHDWVVKELAPPQRANFGVGEEGEAFWRKKMAQWEARQPTSKIP